MKNYLPKNATVPEACEWLATETGEPWTLARLLEHSLMPWVWLDYAPGWPDIFGDRTEGYLAPMIFAGDTARLATVGTDALITMTRVPGDKLIRVTPGLRASIDELRFRRDDITRLAGKHSKPEDAPATKVEAVKGITKQLVINAFEGMHFDRDHWGRNLATPPDWLIDCRVAKGNKKTSATWNPVLIAMALTDPKRGISVNKLDAVFVGLKDWVVAWREASDYLR